MTLGHKVDVLACRCISYEGLVKDMLCTIKLNFERGYLLTTKDNGKLNLSKIITHWENEISVIDGIYPKS